MNKAFVREPEQGVDYCPRCGSAGQQVGIEAVEFYLSKEKQVRVADPANFCPSPRCDVVYFDAFERVILKGDLDKARLSQRSRRTDLCVFRIDPARHRAGC